MLYSCDFLGLINEFVLAFCFCGFLSFHLLYEEHPYCCRSLKMGMKLQNIATCCREEVKVVKVLQR